MSDLQDTARRQIGSSIAHGWLDGRMAAMGWDRCTLDGHKKAGRDGRHYPHLRVNIYRGHLPQETPDANTPETRESIHP